MQKKIDYEVGLVKLSLEQERIQKEEEFATRRKFVDEEYGKLMGVKDSLEILKKENDRLTKENTVLREECKRLREDMRGVYGEVRSKSDRLDQIREELTEAKNSCKDLQGLIADEQRLRKRREQEVSEARRELEALRANTTE